MAANVVNACYRPEMNDICFPAAILHEPIFDINASVESNFGGLGIVAGHELTHAFDVKVGDRMYTKPKDRLSVWWLFCKDMY